jgi:DNA-directed RNA polymerase specialized sigma24 family protein
MPASPSSLLQRLQQHGDQTAWGQLVELFSAHLFLWGCRAGLSAAEAAELVRATFAEVARKLPAFRPGSPGGFRAWLRELAQAQRRELLRKKVPAGGPAAEPALVPPDANVMWEGEYLPFLLRAALDLVQGEFPTQDWKAFRAVTAEGRSPADVAGELGLPVGAVTIAEARVLRRLRQELDGLLD